MVMSLQIIHLLQQFLYHSIKKKITRKSDFFLSKKQDDIGGEVRYIVG